MNKGDIVKIKIEDISDQGQGIGKADGLAVFVKDVVLGDVIEAELTKVKKSYAFGRKTKILEESPHRQSAFCPYYGQCGGCVFQETSYEAQLDLKTSQINEKLKRLGGIENPNVKSAKPSEAIFRYRNKASMVISTGGLITEKGGVVKPVHEPRVGFFQSKSHQVVDCTDCMLQTKAAMASAEALRRFMEEDNITSYDPRWEKGLMRHMVVRTAFSTGQVMVILVINGKGIPNADKLVDMLDQAIDAIAVETEGPLAGVKLSLESVVINVNKKKDSQIFGEECLTIAGGPTILEKAMGLDFEVSPLSFYQVNLGQMEKLYSKILEYADLSGNETVLDLYCGVGTIGLVLAHEMGKKGQGGKVIGIESVKQAVVDANRNAVINGIVNARYICGKAEEVLPKLVKGAPSLDFEAKEKEKKDNAKYEDMLIDKAHVAIIDPPRAGCHEALLQTVTDIAPPKLIYVSCNPATMARDVKLLGERGYELKEVSPVDMFPWTGSIEAVGVLVRNR